MMARLVLEPLVVAVRISRVFLPAAVAKLKESVFSFSTLCALLLSDTAVLVVGLMA